MCPCLSNTARAGTLAGVAQRHREVERERGGDQTDGALRVPGAPCSHVTLRTEQHRGRRRGRESCSEGESAAWSYGGGRGETGAEGGAFWVRGEGREGSSDAERWREGR